MPKINREATREIGISKCNSCNFEIILIKKILQMCNDSWYWEGEALLSNRPRPCGRSAWWDWVGDLETYDNEPDDDLDCLLLFRARSLSPCVRPFRSSSSLYCETKKTQSADKELRVGVSKNNAADALYDSSPAPFPVSWMLCSCCSHWCLCRPLLTESLSPPSYRSRARSAFSPGKRLPLPTGYSACWCATFQRNSKTI